MKKWLHLVACKGNRIANLFKTSSPNSILYPSRKCKSYYKKKTTSAKTNRSLPQPKSFFVKKVLTRALGPIISKSFTFAKEGNKQLIPKRHKAHDPTQKRSLKIQQQNQNPKTTSHQTTKIPKTTKQLMLLLWHLALHRPRHLLQTFL